MSLSDTDHVEVAIVGAGNVGIAVAYYLALHHGITRMVLIDPRDPMSLTSAQSGENYRNWWSHPLMTAFTDHSITLMEELDQRSGGRLTMTRGGYVLVTRRRQPDDLIANLYRSYGEGPGLIRLREATNCDYQPPERTPWRNAPAGVDVLLNTQLIRRTFPSLADDVGAVLHVRRGGSISAQQMGQVMLEWLRDAGVRVRRASVSSITGGAPFHLTLSSDRGDALLRAERIVNAAGPYLRDICQMLGEDIPVKNVYQQKVSFEDREAAIPRDLPFTIDLDGQTLAWDSTDRELLRANPATRHLTEPLPGGIHCRPDGPVGGRWIKLGWALNQHATDVHGSAPIDPHYPEIVLRGASRLHTGLASYIGRLPRGMRHYGGYYTMTPENWPLIGPLRTPGAFVAGALSGFGSMAACATGAICAAWVAGRSIPDYANSLAADRHSNGALMEELAALNNGCL